MFHILSSLEPCISHFSCISEQECIADCTAESSITVYRTGSRINGIGSNPFEILNAKIKEKFAPHMGLANVMCLSICSKFFHFKAINRVARGREFCDIYDRIIEMTSPMPAVTGGGLVGHPPTQASEHREGYCMQRSSACGRNLRWRRHSQQIETSSCRGDDVSLAGPHTQAQWEAPMSMP